MRIKSSRKPSYTLVASSKLLMLELIVLAQTITLLYLTMNQRPSWDDVWKQHKSGYETAILECVERFSKEDSRLAVAK